MKTSVPTTQQLQSNLLPPGLIVPSDARRFRRRRRAKNLEALAQLFEFQFESTCSSMEGEHGFADAAKFLARGEDLILCGPPQGQQRELAQSLLHLTLWAGFDARHEVVGEYTGCWTDLCETRLLLVHYGCNSVGEKQNEAWCDMLERRERGHISTVLVMDLPDDIRLESMFGLIGMGLPGVHLLEEAHRLRVGPKRVAREAAF